MRLDPTSVIEHKNPVIFPLCGLLFTIIFSALHSALLSGADLLDLLARVKNGFSYALFAYLTFKYVRVRREKLFVLGSIVCVTTLNAIYSLRDVVTNPSLNIERNRLVSLITDQPNLYAGFLAMYIFFFLALLIHYPLSRRTRLFLGACTVLVLISFVYTLSRGAWLAFICGISIITFVKSKRLLIPVMLIGLLFVLWMPDVVTERWKSGFEGEYNPEFLITTEKVTVDEAASRIVQWRTFLPLLAEHPIIGVGFGQYGATIFQKGIDYKPRSAHSSIIEIGIEEGIIGLLFYFAILTIIYRNASKIYKETTDPLDKALSLGLLGATVTLLFLDLTGTRFRSSNIMAFYWILTGLTLNVWPTLKRASDHAQSSWRQRIVTAPAAK